MRFTLRALLDNLQKSKLSEPSHIIMEIENEDT